MWDNLNIRVFTKQTYDFKVGYTQSCVKNFVIGHLKNTALRGQNEIER